jgi:uncharacterized protein (TIGR03067 family)
MKRSDHDIETLQGLWKQIGLEADGILNPPDDLSPPGAITAFTDNQFTVRTSEGVLLLEGTFTLDASVLPKTIDYVDSMGPGRESGYRPSTNLRAIPSPSLPPMRENRGRPYSKPAPARPCGLLFDADR